MSVDAARPKTVRGLAGVRGLLALYVVLHHCWLLSFPGYPANTGPAWTGWLVHGRFAVVAFIVLSGFSLGLAPAGRDWRLGSLRGYAARRARRILPAYWAALVLSWGGWQLAAAVTPAPGADPPPPESLWVHGLLLQDVIATPTPNPAFWSIAVEATLYLAFPLLLLVRRRAGAVATLAVSLIPLLVLGPAGTTGFTREFAPLFTLGLLAAGIRSRWVRGPWATLGVAVPVLGLAAVQGPVWTVANYWWIDLAFGPAVALALIAVAEGRHGRAAALLDSRPLRHLGGFSYSLYLIHMPLIAVVRRFSPGFVVTVAVAVPLCLLVAAGFAAVFERRRPLRPLVPLIVAALLGQMAVAMLVTAVRQTPTIDEPVYVGTAVTYLDQHSLRYNPEHPPLGKLIIGAGLSIDRPHLDPGFRGDQTALGRHVLYESGGDPGRLMLLARLPVILLTLLFGLVVFAFARDLTNPAGGLLALTVYAFAPDVITHGSLATLDVPAAGFLLTAIWLTWRARRSHPWTYLPLAGVALGAALSVRASVLPAVAVVLLLVVRRARLVGAVAVGVVAVAVVWLSYLAVDPALSWTPPPGLPDPHGVRGLLVDLVPFPRPYRDGMRIQFGFEDASYSGFLFGHRYEGARWYYLPAALLVKTPLAMLVLWAAAAATLLVLPRLRRAAGYLLAAPALLLLVAMTGARNYGTRYAVCLPIFLAVAVAVLAVAGRRWMARAAATLAALVAVSSTAAFPHYLPYANEAFGGPARTHLYLHDSNVDWGQDLGRLAVHLRTRYPGEPVWLVYKGAGVPSAYGITAGDPLREPPSRVRGLLVVSDSAVAKATGRLARLLATSGTPIDDVGHSISIYRRP